MSLHPGVAAEALRPCRGVLRPARRAVHRPTMLGAAGGPPVLQPEVFLSLCRIVRAMSQLCPAAPRRWRGGRCTIARATAYHRRGHSARPTRPDRRGCPRHIASLHSEGPARSYEALHTAFWVPTGETCLTSLPRCGRPRTVLGQGVGACPPRCPCTIVGVHARTVGLPLRSRRLGTRHLRPADPRPALQRPSLGHWNARLGLTGEGDWARGARARSCNPPARFLEDTVRVRMPRGHSTLYLHVVPRAHRRGTVVTAAKATATNFPAASALARGPYRL